MIRRRHDVVIRASRWRARCRCSRSRAGTRAACRDRRSRGSDAPGSPTPRRTAATRGRPGRPMEPRPPGRARQIDEQRGRGGVACRVGGSRDRQREGVGNRFRRRGHRQRRRPGAGDRRRIEPADGNTEGQPRLAADREAHAPAEALDGRDADRELRRFAREDGRGGSGDGQL